jgi:hypothetical protein
MAEAEIDSKLQLAQPYVEIEERNVATLKKQIEELIALLQLTDQKLQVALDCSNLAEIRCTLLDRELSVVREELDATRRATIHDGTNLLAQPVLSQTAHQICSVAEVQTDVTVACLDIDNRRMAEMQAQLSGALQNSAASHAAFLALERSSSSSSLNLSTKVKEEWALRVDELEQVTPSHHQ